MLCMLQSTDHVVIIDCMYVADGLDYTRLDNLLEQSLTPDYHSNTIKLMKS